MTHPRAARDRGAATVLVVALAGLLVVVGCALSVATALVVDHRRAQAAADLAALAGAGAALRGEDPCAAARDVAGANDARLESCRTVGLDVLVEVSVTGPRWRELAADLEGRARAGPDDGA